MSTALQLVDTQNEAGWDDRKIDIIRKHIAEGIDEGNLAFFAAVCARTGLDPILKQIYIIGRNTYEDGRVTGKTWTIQVGIDGLQLIASRSQEWAGVDRPIFGPDITLDEGKIVPEWAEVTVYRLVRGQRMPFTGLAYFAEYAQWKDEYKDRRKTGNKLLTGKWLDMPRNQLAKCARAQAIRMGFPAETQGVYANEEMEQADNPVRIVDAETGEITRAPRQQAVRPAVANGKLNWGALRLKATQRGIRTQADWEAFARRHLSIADDADFDTRGFTADHYAILDRALDGDASLETLGAGGGRN